jgi:predicted helicase
MSRLLVEQYHKEVETIIAYSGVRNETSIRTSFQRLLEEYCKKKDFKLIPELEYKTQKQTIVKPDGTIKDALRLDWGYWESKDEFDNIDDEIIKKFDKGYPKDNILFEDSKVAVLYQAGNEVARIQMSNADALDKIISTFINYERPEVRNFRDAIENFKQDIPKLSDSLRELIDNQSENQDYIYSRDVFFEICKETINPDIAIEDIREMLIQHILTEDIFNSIFDETQFHRENNIARELEKVLSTFFKGDIKRKFNDNVRHYYAIIKAAASGIANHSEKQKFLKIIYENFYKAYSPKKADRLGVVYTPNEIVKFMIESADYLCFKHFGKLLSDKNVEILDPATGTGTYITELIEYMPLEKMKYKYEHEIHANEVAILPYYIANLNIEFTYQQRTGEYKEFKNICFVDTIDNQGFAYIGQQIDAFSGMSQENKERIKRQNERKISVIIGNPPYNANQMNENENNKNRAYPGIDKRIKDTYIKHSTAQKTKMYDMYSRFYRWSMDRIGEEGIIAFITNRSFINSRTFDGFRKIIQDEFDYSYIIDLGGDIRSKTENDNGNVFDIMVGVAIMFLIKV